MMQLIETKPQLQKNCKWSQIDAGLYNQVFTGQARKLRFCKHCSATTHGSEECVESYWKRPNEEQVGGSKMPKMAKSDVCFLFNQGRCTYLVCKFRHMCFTCAGGHPAYAYPRKVDKVLVAFLLGNPSGVHVTRFSSSLSLDSLTETGLLYTGC